MAKLFLYSVLILILKNNLSTNQFTAGFRKYAIKKPNINGSRTLSKKPADVPHQLKIKSKLLISFSNKTKPANTTKAQKPILK